MPATGLGSSLAEGLRNYRRMWFTRFLAYFSLDHLITRTEGPEVATSVQRARVDELAV
jgi:hypothetical protein